MTEVSRLRGWSAREQVGMRETSLLVFGFQFSGKKKRRKKKRVPGDR